MTTNYLIRWDCRQANAVAGNNDFDNVVVGDVDVRFNVDVDIVSALWQYFINSHFILQITKPHL